VLRSLKINNFALITSLEIEFQGGMTSITGETGAGKSILLEGLSLVLGKRADLSVIKDVNKKCIIEAEFQLDAYALKSFFKEADLDYEPLTLLRREIAPSGKSRTFINDTPVTLTVLEQLSQHLIDIHGQMENAAILQKDFQFVLVDAYAQQQKQVAAFESRYHKLQELLQEQTTLLEQQKMAEDQLSLKRFYFDELHEAQLNAEEFETIQATHAEKQHLDFLIEALANASERLEAEPGGILSELVELRALFNKMSLKSNRLAPLLEQLQNMVSEAEDFRDQVLQMAEAIHFNPEEQHILETKLNQYHALLHKHQLQDVEALIALRDKLELDIEQTTGGAEKLVGLANEIKSLTSQMQKEAAEISQNRKTVFEPLCEALQVLVARMGMPEAKFKFECHEEATFNKRGKDTLELLFCANPGSGFFPLKKIASGGERSRIMLAIKAILARFKKLPTIIFDEIDTGVSGKVSDQIASIMAELANHMQVFAITHLPQVAAKGAQHLKVLKETDGEITQTFLKQLDAKERELEIAQMLSGTETGLTAVAHAKELLK